MNKKLFISACLTLICLGLVFSVYNFCFKKISCSESDIIKRITDQSPNEKSNNINYIESLIRQAVQNGTNIIPYLLKHASNKKMSVVKIPSHPALSYITQEEYLNQSTQSIGLVCMYLIEAIRLKTPYFCSLPEFDLTQCEAARRYKHWWNTAGSYGSNQTDSCIIPWKGWLSSGDNYWKLLLKKNEK